MHLLTGTPERLHTFDRQTAQNNTFPYNNNSNNNKILLFEIGSLLLLLLPPTAHKLMNPNNLPDKRKMSLRHI